MRYYKIWVPLLSIILFVSLAELICRGFNLKDKADADFKFYLYNSDKFSKLEYIVEDAFLMWFNKPNYSSLVLNINSQGFRDKEYKVKKDKNVFRILCLGDSSTFGWGVEIQNTYHSLLENKLNNKLGRKGIRFEVINAGVNAYTSCQGLGLYKHKGFKYTPDIVTFYFGITDEQKYYSFSDKQIMQKDVQAALKAAMENNILLKLHSYIILRKYIVSILGTDKNNVLEKVTRVSLDDFKRNILELNMLCKKNGSLLLLISPPLRKENFSDNLSRNKNIFPYRALLENISKEYKIPLLSINEMTEESPLYTTPFFLDTVHPNQLGHRVIMIRFYDFLITNKLLP